MKNELYHTIWSETTCGETRWLWIVDDEYCNVVASGIEYTKEAALTKIKEITGE
jgi:uncharacterized cupin superfamily protein